MVDSKAMSDAPIVGLQESRCQSKNCHMLLAKTRLSANSVVEIKCRRCNTINLIRPDEDLSDDVFINLVPDGQGGFEPPTTTE